MVFRLIVEKRVEKYLRKLQPKRYKQISGRIHELKYFPLVHGDLDTLKDASEPNSFRIRIGGWRILFTVYKNQKVIKIWKIRPRGDVY